MVLMSPSCALSSPHSPRWPSFQSTTQRPSNPNNANPIFYWFYELITHKKVISEKLHTYLCSFNQNIYLNLFIYLREDLKPPNIRCFEPSCPSIGWLVCPLVFWSAGWLACPSSVCINFRKIPIKGSEHLLQAYIQTLLSSFFGFPTSPHSSSLTGIFPLNHLKIQGVWKILPEPFMHRSL